MIQLTQRAAEHVKSMLSKRGHGIGLRLGAHKAGCTGFMYDFDYADEINDDDLAFDSQDVKVVVSKELMEQLDGCEIDYVTTNALNKGFEIRNPNAKEMCGCGESFHV
ncbi:MAG TPA: iron-sulfur cluster assembly protein IscA [Gammaproteobacteria bacterium]|nr:iron-sulfur cluster assembly protein IscA [Gammaproteobacteria bacterium]